MLTSFLGKPLINLKGGIDFKKMSLFQQPKPFATISMYGTFKSATKIYSFLIIVYLLKNLLAVS